MSTIRIACWRFTVGWKVWARTYWWPRLSARRTGTTTKSVFRAGGRWWEVFKTDVDDKWVPPGVGGSGGGIDAAGPPRDALGSSATTTTPANGFVVFARQ